MRLKAFTVVLDKIPFVRSPVAPFPYHFRELPLHFPYLRTTFLSGSCLTMQGRIFLLSVLRRLCPVDRL